MKSVSPTETTPCLSAEKLKEGNVSSPKLSCDVKGELLRDYIAALERVQVAEREHTATLVTAGTSDGMALRSSQGIEAIKALRNAARERYSDHCHIHRC
jgi:hypothetical protein